MAQPANQKKSVDEVIKEIKMQPGFKAYILLNNDGIVVRMDQFDENVGLSYAKAVHYASHILPLYDKTRKQMELMAMNPAGVESIRLKSNSQEVIVSQIAQYTLVVIHEDVH